MRRQVLTSSIMVLVISLFLAGCNPPEQAPAPVTTTPTAQPPTTISVPEKTIPTGTLRVASRDFRYESFDPIFYESFWGWAIYDPLLSWDAQGNIIGSVAESHTLSPDGKTWTFKIRKGITFHNGDPLTAADVAFSLDRFSSKESTNPNSPYLRNNFASMTVLDDYTVEYKTIHPEPALAVSFAWVRILPKRYFSKGGGTLGNDQ